MKNKSLVYGGLGILGVSLAGIGIASAAMGGVGGGSMLGGMMGLGGGMTPAQSAAAQQTEFQNEASVTGLSLSTIADGWAKGESLQQIATANGVSQTQLQANLKNFQQTQLKAELDAMVAAGTITQVQETTRLATVATQQTKMTANAGKVGGRGHGPRTATSTAPKSN